jgi:hypothetical protein
MDNVSSTPSDTPELSERAREAVSFFRYNVVGGSGPGWGPRVDIGWSTASSPAVEDGDVVVVSHDLSVRLILKGNDDEWTPRATFPASMTVCADGSRRLVLDSDIDLVAADLDRRDLVEAIEGLRSSAFRADPSIEVLILLPAESPDPSGRPGWLHGLLNRSVESPVQRQLAKDRKRDRGKPSAYTY